MNETPIAQKYCEGKVKRPLKRECKKSMKSSEEELKLTFDWSVACTRRTQSRLSVDEGGRQKPASLRPRGPSQDRSQISRHLGLERDEKRAVRVHLAEGSKPWLGVLGCVSLDKSPQML
jgi:hypothetical protein